MVFPAVTRGRIDPSAIRRLSIPWDFQVAIDDRHRIAAHPGSPRFVPKAGCGVANELLELEAPEIARHNFAFHKRTKRSSVADLAAEFDAGDGRFEIGRIGQR